MISVALTTYNGADFVLEQLRSILNQTQSVDEIVICDDGSKDQSVALIQNFLLENNVQNVRLIQNQENLGYKKNFIKAMMLCHGDFVFLSDQDDIWMPNKVEKMLSVMEDERIKVLASSFEYIEEHGNPIKQRKEDKPNNDGLYTRKNVESDKCIPISFKELLRENYFQGASLCLKKEVVHEVCSTYKDYITHDWFINLTAAKQEGMYYLNSVLFQYRIHEKNNLGIPSKNNSFFGWIVQANVEEKRTLAFVCGKKYIEQCRESNDSFYQNHKKELDDIDSFFTECLELFEQRKLMKMIQMNKTEEYCYFRNRKTRIMDLFFILTHRGIEHEKY